MEKGWGDVGGKFEKGANFTRFFDFFLVDFCG